MAGNPELIALLRGEIDREGPIPFRRFMEAALYHPQWGYYRRGDGPEVGRRGDFYTNASVGPLYGRLLGLQFAQMWRNLGAPDGIALIEQGAHDGRFLADVLAWARAEDAAFFAALRVAILEPSPALRRRQEAMLAPFAGKVTWPGDPCPPFPEAIFFSNELPDSFPVHRIVLAATGWAECRVAWRDGAFAWETGPLSTPELAAATAALPDLPTGTVTEVNLAARAWIAATAALFARGYAVTVDYGWPEALYYAPHRVEGTLLAYRDHRSSSDLLAHAGEQDLTAHVDFTALARAGEAAGLRTLGFADQHHFLVGLLEAFPGAVPDDDRSRRAFRTLMHPETMGTTFKILVQGKNVPGETVAGLKNRQPLQ